MGSRRRSKTFTGMLISAAVIVLTSWFYYQYRLHRLELITNYRLNRIEHLRPKPERQVQLTPEQMTARQAEAQRQAELDRQNREKDRLLALEAQRKEEAWNQFFTPTNRCQIPGSQQMIKVCEANESKFRARFESEWSANVGTQK